MDFEVRRDDLAVTRVVDSPRPELAAGEVELAIDHFAFTANNVTYGVVGEAFSYWKFFPGADDGWGRIPVWGYATVARSAHDQLQVGDRFYGYYPMSTHLIVRPSSLTAGGFVDGSAHRAGLPGIYNRYRCAGDEPEEVQMLLRPQFMTAFLIDDELEEHAGYGAERVVLSSASSKTAYATAFLLERRRAAGGPAVIGLTSPANAAFVARLGLYDEVVTYDRIAELSQLGTALFIDFAGSGAVRRAVHERLEANLTRSIGVGSTHWRERERGAALPGPAPVFFFAPDRARKRGEDWGPAVLQQRIGAAWQAFLEPLLDPARGWLRVVNGRGPEAVERVYRDALAGKLAPDEGHVLALHT